MQSATNNNETLLTQAQTAERLAVSIDTLTSWKDGKILTPILTSDGQDYYSQQQVDFFLKITQLVETDRINPRKIEASDSTPQLVDENHMTLNSSQNSGTPNVSSQPGRKMKTPYSIGNRRLVASAGLSFALILLVIVFGLQLKHRDTKALSLNSQKNAENQKVLGAQSINETSEPQSGITSSGNQENILASKTLKNTNEGLRAQTSSQDEAYAQPIPEGNTNVTTGDISSLASYVSQVSENNKNNMVFDGTGRIKGDVKDTIATTLGGIGSFGAPPIRQANSPLINMIILVGGTLLSLLLFYPKRFSFTGKDSLHMQPATFYAPSTSEKVIEVNQKADGTIVFNLQDKEFKISKPELYSESDQFIERLMELTKPDVKEIDYVSLEDENIELTTPLSRLVTRLGFVGMKRDLFFPRTSKDRVFFRKYVTSQDLEDMDLTTEQILEDLISVN